MASTLLRPPDAFLSYTRNDDEYTGGQITMFRQHLELAVQAVTGKPFVIFQDVDGIGLGEHWQDKLDLMINQAQFFLPMITPSFFESRPCRAELEHFLKAERQAGRNDLILPIYCLDTDVLEDEAQRANDPLAQLIHERQGHDWRGMIFQPFETPDVKISLQRLARKIREASKRQRIVSPTKSTTSPSQPVRMPETGAVFRDVTAPWCPELVLIPPGTFQMGSPEGEEEREPSESPRHQVAIERRFALGRCPVTRGEFATFVQDTGHRGKGLFVHRNNLWRLDRTADWQSPGFAQTANDPVVGVNRSDALAYLAWLSDKTGKRYDLPSEAMWEYACRAGTTTPFGTGRIITTDQANYDGKVAYGGVMTGAWREATTEVAHFPPNAFGLHDMHGNVWEWCADRWHGSYEGAPSDGTAWLTGNGSRYVVRGGSWLNAPHLLRSARRFPLVSDVRYHNVGFRCARLLD